MSRNFTLAVERVADDRRFAARFRDDPVRALRRYRLRGDQIDAIKSGEPAALARHGLDLDRFQSGRRHGWRPWWRKALAGVTIAGAVIGLVRTPAAAFPDVCKDVCLPRRGPRIAGVRRASLRQARLGRAIRVDQVLLERSSIRRAFARHGIRVGYGRIALRRALGIDCPDGCETVIDGDPIVLAD